MSIIRQPGDMRRVTAQDHAPEAMLRLSQDGVWLCHGSGDGVAVIFNNLTGANFAAQDASYPDYLAFMAFRWGYPELAPARLMLESV